MNTPFRPQQIAIVGAGASGCLCAYFLLKAGFEVTIFDKGSPLRTLLPTGGGRCNLAHAEYDFKELAKNYPRGEKFLYSVFSKFSTYDTLSLFSELGVETYTQGNGRIFPTSNSARDVREKISSKIKKASIINENVLEVLKREGYIAGYEKANVRPGVDELRIQLKYHEGTSVITEIYRVSTPGRRVYSSVRDLPRVYNGLGISIVSTPKGVMSDNEARKANVGGEILCQVF